MDTNNEGIVYVLKNPAFPNLVKIGITTRDHQKMLLLIKNRSSKDSKNVEQMLMRLNLF